jgi:hypothetical protein
MCIVSMCKIFSNFPAPVFLRHINKSILYISSMIHEKYLMKTIRIIILSGEFSAKHAQREVVKMKNLDFSYWASTP